MKVDIWMPIYIGDYIRDTQELTAEEHGAYFLLLMHYWQKDGKIGNNVKRLSVVAKTSKETISYLLENYFILNNGNYRNKRADIEMESAKARSSAARKNVQKRWNKQKDDTIVLPPYNDGNTIDDTESIPNGYSSPSPSPPSSSLPASSSTPSDIKNLLSDEIKEIMSYFNEICGTAYKDTSQKTKSLIQARTNEGFTVDDFKIVIRKKYESWNNDPKMREYLRPITLFSNKFESYLNQPDSEHKEKPKYPWEDDNDS